MFFNGHDYSYDAYVNCYKQKSWAQQHLQAAKNVEQSPPIETFLRCKQARELPLIK